MLTVKLKKLLTETDIVLSEFIIAKLVDYIELIAKWNKVHNLTAIKTVDEMLTKHILDSLSLVPYINGDSLLDVGSGAGLPGVVIAIVCPEVRVTVLDSNNKKTQFLNQVKIQLELGNLDVVHSRVEDHKAENKYSMITSRAFSSVDKFVDNSWIFIQPDGVFLAMKGTLEQTKLELDALDSRFAVQSINEIRLQEYLGERNLVIIKKCL